MVLLVGAFAGPGPGQAADSFTNPVFRSQDPYLEHWEGHYYYSESDGDRITVRKSPSLTGLGSAPEKVVWISPRRGWDGHANVWAPEIHLVNGKWYIYYAADFATDGRHRLYVLEGGANPLDAYSIAKTGAPDGQLTESFGKWAIDPNVFYGPNHTLYLTWSCADDEVGRPPQSLCLAAMSDALHTKGSTVRISTPARNWELRSGAVQEGPVGLTHDGSTYITYSASASWTTNDYCVGVLRNNTGDLLNPMAWEKRGPIFDRHNQVFGPGSVVFTESPDGSESWCLYHAYDRLNCRQWGCRSIRMQRLKWDVEGWPLLSYPADPGTALATPSGEGNAGSKAAGDAGLLAYSLSAEIQLDTQSGRYGLYALYRDERNYVQALLDMERRVFISKGAVDGEEYENIEQPFPNEFAASRNHTVRVDKSGQCVFTFFLDSVLMHQRRFGLDFGEIGLQTHTGDARFRNVAVIDQSWSWQAEADTASMEGHWDILNAATATSVGDGGRWSTLYQGNPNYQDFTLQTQAQALSGDPRYGVMACFQDSSNQASFWIDSNLKELKMQAIVHGVTSTRTAGLPQGFDPAQFHTLTVTKSGTFFTFWLDGEAAIRSNLDLVNGYGGIMAERTRVNFRNFTIAHASQ